MKKVWRIETVCRTISEHSGQQRGENVDTNDCGVFVNIVKSESLYSHFFSYKCSLFLFELILHELLQFSYKGYLVLLQILFQTQLLDEASALVFPCYGVVDVIYSPSRIIIPQLNVDIPSNARSIKKPAATISVDILTTFFVSRACTQQGLPGVNEVTPPIQVIGPWIRPTQATFWMAGLREWQPISDYPRNGCVQALIYQTVR